jgi:hypothetical protein
VVNEKRADSQWYPRWYAVKFVAGFTNSEEAAVGLTDVVPFLVEESLKQNGGEYSKAACSSRRELDYRPESRIDGSGGKGSLGTTGRQSASAERGKGGSLKTSSAIARDKTPFTHNVAHSKWFKLPA